MTTCNRCGELITFRKIDGKTIPIHPNGGCKGSYGGRNRVRVLSPQIANKTVFDDPQSYLNPNAKCPVCGKSVFFYQSEHGGRVFFDDVGWPWPKHPCTDRAVARSSATIYAPSRYSSDVSADWTKNYMFFRLLNIRRESGRLYLSVKESTKGLGGFFRSLFFKTERIYSFGEEKLELADLQDSDFRQAPSFLIARDELTSERAVIQFICPRKGKIVRLRMKRIDAR